MLRKLAIAVFLSFSLKLASAILTNRSDDFVDFILTESQPMEDHFLNSNKCTVRLHTSLEKLRRRQAHLKSAGFIDLSGYALHQSLRHLPLDMYVTDIRVRTPGVGDWVRIEKCQFSNRDKRMTTQILFNDLTVSGNVQLLDDTEMLKNSFQLPQREFCKMSLRFQRAGLGINAFPTRGRSKGIDVRTEAKFMNPRFLSVHAYGCKLNDIFKRAENDETPEPYSSEANKQVTPNDKYIESQIQDRLSYNRSDFTTTRYRHDDWSPRSRSDNQESGNLEDGPEVRVITLNPGIRTGDDQSLWFNLHKEEETGLNDYHRSRILGTRLHTPTERDRLKAVLHVKNIIAQQANHVFQTQGPFSQNPKPLFKPFQPAKPVKGISSITELDENLMPIRPVSQRPFEALFSQSDQPNNQNFQINFDEVSREMEDIFLRGIKTLLTRYVEKQLEIPLKEALMVNIGYTVSYG